MTTFREFFDKMNVPLPPIPHLSSEDIPMYILTVLTQPEDKKVELLTNLVFALALKLEDMEQELFEQRINR